MCWGVGRWAVASIQMFGACGMVWKASQLSCDRPDRFIWRERIAIHYNIINLVPIIRSPHLIFMVVRLLRNALMFARGSVASTQMLDAAARSGIEANCLAGVHPVHLARMYYQ